MILAYILLTAFASSSTTLFLQFCFGNPSHSFYVPKRIFSFFGRILSENAETFWGKLFICKFCFNTWVSFACIALLTHTIGWHSLFLFITGISYYFLNVQDRI